MNVFSNIELRYERRLCEVKGETGYFHCWEQFSRPISESILRNGPPGGVFSKIFGIVEFTDRVERVEVENIKFVDEDNDFLNFLSDVEMKFAGKKE